MNLTVVGFGGLALVDSRYVLDEAVKNYFESLREQCDNLDVYVPAPSPGYSMEIDSPVSISVYDTSRFGFLKLLRRLCIGKKGALLLFMPACTRLAPFISLLRMRYSSIVVYLADDPFAFGHMIKLSRFPLMTHYYNRLCANYMRNVDGLIVRGNYLCRTANRYNKRVVITSPLYAILKKRNAHSRSNGDVYTILTFSRLVFSKGYEVLFLALRRLLDRKKIKLRLRLAGDGPDRELIEEMAKSIIPDVDYSFLGWVSDTEKKQGLWDQADLHVLATLTTEGVPRCIDEACLVGVPTIATKVGGIPDEYGADLCLITPGSVEEMLRALEGFICGDFSSYYTDGIEAREKYLRAMKPAGQQHFEFIKKLEGRY